MIVFLLFLNRAQYWGGEGGGGGRGGGNFLLSGNCHCKDCQKATGSGKATIIYIPSESLKINDDYKVYSVIGYEGSNVNRGFCPNCGSPIISYVSEQPDVKFIKAGSLDDSSWLKIESSFLSDTGELLGAHMVGAEVTELIQGYVLGQKLETTEEDLISTVFPHPTLSEMMHESVLDAYDRAIHI